LPFTQHLLATDPASGRHTKVSVLRTMEKLGGAKQWQPDLKNQAAG
jgi:hypothetical protein